MQPLAGKLDEIPNAHGNWPGCHSAMAAVMHATAIEASVDLGAKGGPEQIELPLAVLVPLRPQVGVGHMAAIITACVDTARA